MTNTNTMTGSKPQASIFGPLPAVALSLWNLLFIGFAIIFLALAWQTQYPEILDCTLQTANRNTSPDEQLTLIANNKSFDFTALTNHKSLLLFSENDTQEVCLSVQVQRISPVLINEQLQILIHLNVQDFNAADQQQLEQAQKISLIIEDNRLLEKLIAPLQQISF